MCPPSTRQTDTMALLSPSSCPSVSSSPSCGIFLLFKAIKASDVCGLQCPARWLCRTLLADALLPLCLPLPPAFDIIASPHSSAHSTPLGRHLKWGGHACLPGTEGCPTVPLLAPSAPEHWARHIAILSPSKDVITSTSGTTVLRASISLDSWSFAFLHLKSQLCANSARLTM